MEANAENRAKVVAHLSGGQLIKGYLSGLADGTPASLMEIGAPDFLSSELRIEAIDSGEEVAVLSSSLKALYFVRSFTGNKEHNEIKFFDAHPPIDGLWVRIQFGDGEITEGITRNGIDLIRQPGFYLKPPDPKSNNDLILVVKEALERFVVLGVKERI